MIDIIVTLKYSSGEEKEFIEPITEILSFEEIDKYLKKKYYNAISIEWHERDTLTEDY
ncbi:hypothetical protein ACTFJW_07385 [Clostridium cagae]|uniref:hypothetical protein n=1 Tax=Clostridium cagae TaxID=2080751 RepID=UPI003F766446